MKLSKKNFLFLIIIITIFTLRSFLYADIGWLEYKSDHFLIYFHKDIPADYIKRVSEEAEGYYESIAENLGFDRYEGWIWDERAKLYIFKDAEEYRKDSLQSKWSGGSVTISSKVIKTYLWSEGFFEKLLPHELGHIIFRDFVGFNNNVPLWLDEGVAVLQEKTDIKFYTKTMRRIRIPIPMESLNRITAKTLIAPVLYYAQAASVVDYLLSKFDKEKFIKLCKYLKEGKRFIAALDSAYSFEDLNELDKAWLEYIRDFKD